MSATNREWKQMQQAAKFDNTLAKLLKARDPLDRERLSRSLAQLQELERILAGRPLPGALRPSGKVSRSAAGNVEPV